MMVDMSVIIRVFASVPPAIMIVLGFLLIIMGSTSEKADLTGFGIWFVIGGIALQVLWIFFRGGRRGRIRL